MIYKFLLISDEVPNFERVIEIDADNTFLDFQKAIFKSVNFEDSELSSFFICNDDWEKEQEITRVDMGSDSAIDIYLMEEAVIRDFIEEKGQKLLFVFDILSERAFFIELKGITYEKYLDEAVCTRSSGKAPKQTTDIEEVLADMKKSVRPAGDFDGDFDDEVGYNDDEFDAEGYTSIDDLDESWR